MIEYENKKVIEREQLLAVILKIITDMISDWEMEFDDTFDADSYLGADFGLQSVELLRLISGIQQKYDQTLIPFEELFLKDSAVVEDIQISELVDFLFRHLNKPN